MYDPKAALRQSKVKEILVETKQNQREINADLTFHSTAKKKQQKISDLNDESV